MKYYSTRDVEKLHPYSLEESVFMGLAPDGGLFMPESIPQVDMTKLKSLAAKSFADMALYVAGLLFDDVPADDLEKIVRDAYDFPVTLHSLSPEFQTLELFHGPTCAFKDFAARFMGRMTGYLNKGGKLTILTATSGDTGSAVAGGFLGVKDIDVIILYPDGKVSPLQEAQMTTLGQNIHAVKVKGSFDDCQRMVKELFNDAELRKSVRITSANSINILRWMSQSFYYFYAYCLWAERTGKEAPEIVVPSGNYGNITAGMLAHKMGMPVKGFVAASNANDVVPQFLISREYKPRESVQTYANAMDVGAPSNFERMIALYNNNLDELCSEVRGFSCNDQEILESIKEIYDKYDYYSDPHSAIGYKATKDLNIDGFWLSTAHAAKFGETIVKATSKEAPIPERLYKLLGLERKFICAKAESSEIKKLLQ